MTLDGSRSLSDPGEALHIIYIPLQTAPLCDFLLRDALEAGEPLAECPVYRMCTVSVYGTGLMSWVYTHLFVIRYCTSSSPNMYRQSVASATQLSRL